MAALDAAVVRAILGEAGIPYKGERLRIAVAAADYGRARKVIAAALAGGATIQTPMQFSKIRVAASQE